MDAMKSHWCSEDGTVVSLFATVSNSKYQLGVIFNIFFRLVRLNLSVKSNDLPMNIQYKPLDKGYSFQCNFVSRQESRYSFAKEL